MIKVLAFDLDDTLLDSRMRIGAKTLEALEEWLARGRHVFLATSRPIRAVKRFVPENLLNRCQAITLNGVVSQFGQGEPAVYARLGKVGKYIGIFDEMGRRNGRSVRTVRWRSQAGDCR